MENQLYEYEIETEQISYRTYTVWASSAEEADRKLREFSLEPWDESHGEEETITTTNMTENKKGNQ